MKEKGTPNLAFDPNKRDLLKKMATVSLAWAIPEALLAGCQVATQSA